MSDSSLRRSSYKMRSSVQYAERIIRQRGASITEGKVIAEQTFGFWTSHSRWEAIEKEATESAFGNVVNFPFSAVKDHWPETVLSFDPSTAIASDIPTLFITGTLDCRTPVEQVEEIMHSFSNTRHVKVKNAGHEQAQWAVKVADYIIPLFIKGELLESTTVNYSAIEFINLTGEASGHPAIK